MNEYKYVSVIYDDDIVAKTINEPSFYYKTAIEDIGIDDKVLVDRSGKEVKGIVVDIEYFDKDNIPYPIEKTKDIIKIIEKAPESTFYIDPCDHYMLVIHDSDIIEEQLTVARGFVRRKDSTDIEKLINKSDIIATVGNINISKYDLSKKFIMNINNTNNKGKHTTNTELLSEEESIKFINAFDYGLFYVGFITIDLYDIDHSMGSNVKFKSYSVKDKDKIFEDFDPNTTKKIFIVFESPVDTMLHDINDIVEEIRDKFDKCDLSFGVPVLDNIDEIKIDIFYEV